MWSCSVKKMFLKRGSKSVALPYIQNTEYLFTEYSEYLLWKTSANIGFWALFLVFGLLLTVAISEKVWGLLFSLFL